MFSAPMPKWNPKTRFLTWTVLAVVGIIFWCYRLWGLCDTVRNQSRAVQESIQLLHQAPGEKILQITLETATIARDTMQMIVWLAALYGLLIAVYGFASWEAAREFRKTTTADCAAIAP